MSARPEDERGDIDGIEFPGGALDADFLASAASGPDLTPLDVQSPLGHPAWHEPTGSLLALPYAAIGIVRVLQDGEVAAFGTCWRIASDTAITAAHVVRAAQGPGVSFRIDFPDERMAEVTRVVVPDDYRGREPFDEWDVALLRLRTGTRPFLVLGAQVPADVQLVGFPASSHAMVESGGDALAPDDTLLLHRADTSAGHSGGPLLMSAAPGSVPAVVGIHIGGFSSNPLAAPHPRRNVALALRPSLRDFIRTHT
jgi:V8-like Glu-specific endopeptidase